MNKLRKVIIFGIYLAFLLPFIFTSRTMYPWHFGKTILFQMLAEILVVLAIVYYFRRRTSNNLDVRRLKLNLLDWLIIVFLVVQIIAAVFGVNFNRSFWGNQQRAQGVFTWLHFGAFYFLLRYFYPVKCREAAIPPTAGLFNRVNNWQKLSIWTLIIAAISGLIAWIGPHISFFDNIIGKGGQLSGMIGNPIFFASYLIIPVFLGFAMFFLIAPFNKGGEGGFCLKIGGVRLWQWLTLATAVFLLITLLFSGTRGAFLGLLGGIFVVWLLYLIFGLSKKTKISLAVAGVITVVIFGGLYFFNRKSSYLKNNFPIVNRLLSLDIAETTASTRLLAWQIALEAWRDRPILGWGPENFQDAFDRHYNPKFLGYSFAETVWDKPHSYPLEVLSATGTVGFAVYLAILTTVFIYLIRMIRGEENENGRLFFMILVGAVVAYVIQASFSFETSNSLLIWIFLLALISSSFSIKTPDIINGRPISTTRGVLSFFFILILLVIPYALYKNYALYKASVLMGDARDAAEIGSVYQWQKSAQAVLAHDVPFLWEQAIFLTKDLSDMDGAGKLDKKTLDLAAPKLIEVFNNEIKQNHGPYLFRFWLSQLYAFLGEYVDGKYYDEANKMLEEARRFSPERQHIPLLLAKNYLLQKKIDEAIKVLSEVAVDNPDYGEPHWFLGLALMQKGEEERGVEELEKGKEFGINFKGNILYLIDIYAKRKEYAKIIPLYELLVEREPANASYYASLAATYAALSDKENVIININKAVELDPDLAAEAKVFLEQNGIR